mgnify:CR=1 FL=1
MYYTCIGLWYAGITLKTSFHCNGELKQYLQSLKFTECSPLHVKPYLLVCHLLPSENEIIFSWFQLNPVPFFLFINLYVKIFDRYSLHIFYKWNYSKLTTNTIWQIWLFLLFLRFKNFVIILICIISRHIYEQINTFRPIWSFKRFFLLFFHIEYKNIFWLHWEIES